MFYLVCIVGAVALGSPPTDPVQRVELAHGHYLLARAADRPADTPLPLVVCLHGTETSAEDILRFWRSLPASLPFVYVAPQGSRAGWRASDLPLLREMLDHVHRTVAFDPNRVLLTGHSAGGAMAFRSLYVERFPATAVAVTANYLPPNITTDQVRARAEVPILYAVGRRDLNHTRMRKGVGMLRNAGVRITMHRPRIGHVLDRGVGQNALEWFERVCRDDLAIRIDQAHNPPGSPGPLAADLETVLRYPETHFRDQVSQVREALARLEAPARRTLARARDLAGEHKYAEAHGLYVCVERDFRPASLAEVARAARLSLERDPHASADIAAPRAKREAQALLVWTSVEQALARSDRRAAARGCRELLANYPHSIKADDARAVLQRLQKLKMDDD